MTCASFFNSPSIDSKSSFKTFVLQSFRRTIAYPPKRNTAVCMPMLAIISHAMRQPPFQKCQYLNETPTLPPLPIFPHEPPAQNDWEFSCHPAQVSTTTPSLKRDKSPTPTRGAMSQTLLCWSRPT